jgi:hypothetical protein
MKLRYLGKHKKMILTGKTVKKTFDFTKDGTCEVVNKEAEYLLATSPRSFSVVEAPVKPTDDK